MEIIYREICPKCEKVNQYSGGDGYDLTNGDVDGLRCWNCKHEWLLEGWEDVDPDMTLETACVEDGRRKE